MDNDVKRFMALVRKESDKDEDFVMDRVRETTLFKLIESRYDNVDEICAVAMRKSTWYERMKEILTNERKYIVRTVVMNTSIDEQARNLMFRTGLSVSRDPEKHRVIEKFIWRYGIDEALRIATEIVRTYPADGTLFGSDV